MSHILINHNVDYTFFYCQISHVMWKDIDESNQLKLSSFSDIYEFSRKIAHYNQINVFKSYFQFMEMVLLESKTTPQDRGSKDFHASL